jgi:murein DD-endopeptidase MepM/ murein hydrolase activator NlpD
VLPVAVALFVGASSPAIAQRTPRFLFPGLAIAGGAPRILAGFGDWRGAEGYPRLDPHRGIDVLGRVGSDVLAAAAGRVVVARDSQDLCGLIVVVVHDPHGYRTVYCHRRSR